MRRPLSAEERQRLEQLFERATALSPIELASFVEAECEGNDALRAELEWLLAGRAGDDHLIRALRVPPARVGTSIGPYRLLEQIGEGGMGQVFAAEQREPVSRRVALKVIKPGMDSTQVIARFEAERQALARMAHPHIAQVFDAGTTDEGLPYFVMELVAGDQFNEYCDRHKLSTRERLELFLAICDGVQHAHQKGIIHRDLKPSNLLVTRRDGRAVPKVIDFGVARATIGRLAERTLHTQLGQIVGTLDYMSPEQADPTGLDIDTRSDIYSLGVVLYQVLCGLLPFEHSSTVGVQLSDVQRSIREQEPPTPSKRLRRQGQTATAVAVLHGTDARSLVRRLSGDLDWICLKALEKDPARRYASASELADDVRRHLAHEPVLASPPSSLYRARKFLRRNRGGVIAAALICAGIVVGLLGILSGWQRARALQPQVDEYEARVLLEQVDQLWPPYAELIPELERWLARARTLVQSLPQHRALLAELVTGATSSSESSRELSSRDLLSTLVQELIELGNDDQGLLATDGVVPGRGWSIPKRLAFARSLASGDGEYARAWREKLPLLAERYPWLELVPQTGLLPIGRDVDSGLEEFAHLATGAPAKRTADGQLLLTEETGVVLVLFPGDSFWMGRQSADSLGHNYDPLGPASLDRVREVELSPFFLSKYELTQGQWKRLTGQNPSDFGPDNNWDPSWLSSGAPPSLLHPVEQVSWNDFERWLPRVGLRAPTEAQWEYGARGGTETAFWPGPLPSSLEGVANVSDTHSRDNGGMHDDDAPVAFDDGSTMHCAVGSYAPNAFGLYDVHGNILEWCLDGYFTNPSYDDSSLLLDPVAPWEDVGNRPGRGGSFRLPQRAARLGSRQHFPATHSGHALGIRPARAVNK